MQLRKNFIMRDYLLIVLILLGICNCTGGVEVKKDIDKGISSSRWFDQKAVILPALSTKAANYSNEKASDILYVLLIQKYKKNHIDTINLNSSKHLIKNFKNGFDESMNKLQDYYNEKRKINTILLDKVAVKLKCRFLLIPLLIKDHVSIRESDEGKIENIYTEAGLVVFDAKLRTIIFSAIAESSFEKRLISGRSIAGAYRSGFKKLVNLIF